MASRSVCGSHANLSASELFDEANNAISDIETHRRHVIIAGDRLRRFAPVSGDAAMSVRLTAMEALD
jgi:uncharacterized 2Fe-2S/4Fe-4S cluster protein (DUF4445 family)